MLGSIDLVGDVVEKGGYKKILIEINWLFPILDPYDPTRQIGWNVEWYEDERELFVPGLLDVNVTAHSSAIVLRKWRKTLHQLLKAVIET
jgi:hypothetical protein